MIRLLGALAIVLVATLVFDDGALAQDSADDGSAASESPPVEMLMTTPFRIRNAQTNTYLARAGTSVVALPLDKADDNFLWVMERVDRPNHAWTNWNEYSSWYRRNHAVDCRNAHGPDQGILPGGKCRIYEPETYYKIASVTNGYYLTSVPGQGTQVLVPRPGAVQLWKVMEPDGARSAWHARRALAYFYEPRGAVMMVGEPESATIRKEDLAGLFAIGNGVDTSPSYDFGDTRFNWYLEEAPDKKKDLAKLTIISVEAIATSTGQDGNTRFMFDALQAAMEYGPGLVSGGSGLGAKALIFGAKKSLQAGVKEAGKQIAKLMAEKVAVTTVRTFGKRAIVQAEKRALKAALLRSA